LEHQFQFYKIQSLDINQIPRMPADYEAFFKALSGAPARLWQLANTRYLLAVADYLDSLNAQLDPAQRRFRIHTAFALANRPSGYPGVQTNATGPFALMEFTGALPRTMLHTRWQNFNPTNDVAILDQLKNPSFDPTQEVLVAGFSPAANTNAAPNANPGTVEIVRYASKEVLCKAKIDTASIFLLNDRYHPHWKVWVDGQPDTLLRCNYIMRGVFLPPGNHEIKFRFEPPSGGLYVTLSAMLAGLALCGWVALGTGKNSNAPWTMGSPATQSE
jgi:hypothetical protein